MEKREEFFSELNNFINLTFEIQAAKDSQKAILERLFDAKDVDLKRGVFNKRFRGIVAQHLEDKARQESEFMDDVVADWEIAKDKLR